MAAEFQWFSLTWQGFTVTVLLELISLCTLGVCVGWHELMHCLSTGGGDWWWVWRGGGGGRMLTRCAMRVDLSQ